MSDDIRVMKNLNYAIEALTAMGYNVVKPERPKIQIEHAEELFFGVLQRVLERYGDKMEKRLEARNVKGNVIKGPHREIIEWLEDNRGQGLLLMGKPGNGKSVIAMSVIPLLVYMTTERVVGSYHVRELKEKWTDVISKSIIVIDDVGTEGTVNEYGTKRDYFMELMELAEAKNKIVVVTTNCNGDELRKKYDDRTYSRICGMCRPVVFDGDDFRKRKKQ